jgi:hypothetical protein
VALVVPGIGPIVANGPLAAGLGEAAGHLAGGLGKALERAGLPHRDAEMWEQRVKAGGVLIGAHVHDTSTERLAEALRSSGASLITVCQWPE